MTINALLHPNPAVVLRVEFDDYALLFDPETNKGFGLDETGLSIWNMIDGKHGFVDILAEIRRRFDSIPLDVETDVAEFLEELVAEGLAGYEHD